jgi:hypothetical protein
VKRARPKGAAFFASFCSQKEAFPLTAHSD